MTGYNSEYGPQPISRESDSAGLEWGPHICISNKVSSDADAAVPKTPLWEPLN